MKLILFAISVILSAASLFADDLDAALAGLFPAGKITELRERGMLQHNSYREPSAGLEFAPKTALVDEAASFWDGSAPPFFSETLYLYAKPAGMAAEPGHDVQKIADILRSLSRLQGIEYFSTSRNAMRTLYESSYAVSDPEKRLKIADPTGGSADGQVIYAVQKDLTFGEYLYRYAYRETADSVAFYSRNEEGLKYTFVKLINRDRMHVSLVVRDLGSHLLIYSLTRVDFFAIPGIEKKINASFTTRADAIYRWFINEYERS